MYAISYLPICLNVMDHSKVLAPQFPPDSVPDRSVLSDSTLTTVCPWKGTASYYNITVDGDVLKDAAWYYPTPKDGAKNIKDHLAFCESI